MTAVAIVAGSAFGTVGLCVLVGWYVVRLLERAHKAERSNDALTLGSAARKQRIKELELINAKKVHSDPLINAAFAQALDALPPTASRIILDNLAAGRLHKDGQGAGPGPDAKPLPDAPAIPLADKLL